MEAIYRSNKDKFEFCAGDEESQFGCLCTFPFNYISKELSEGTVASLALLGAAVAISNNQPSQLERQEWNMDDHYYLPYCIPKWIQDEILRVLKLSE